MWTNLCPIVIVAAVYDLLVAELAKFASTCVISRAQLFQKLCFFIIQCIGDLDIPKSTAILQL